jgi:hypothetical protein
MTDHCNIAHPLKREGTYQWQRLADGLKKGFFKPDDRSLEDMLKQIARYASSVRYYDTAMNEWGNWEAFFDYLYDYQNKKLKEKNIDAFLARGDVPAHLGLMLSFLKTLQASRDEFNDFTNRHLNFYYRDILQLREKKAVPDNVAVIFEPEKNIPQARVAAATALNAGKDATGKDLVYTTTREIIVNQIAVAAKKTIYADKSANQLNGLYMSAAADTDNRFTQNNVSSWRTFGSTANKKAEIGFAITSPLLFAKEGRRRLSIEIEGGADMPRNSLVAWFTGPKGWEEADVDLSPGIDFNSSATSRRFLLIKMDESKPAIAAYNEKMHKAGYPFSNPVVKIMIRNDQNFNKAFNFFSSLKRSSIKKIVLNVEGVKSFTIVGENGKLNPLQAFKPFGNNPVKNKSFFTIGNTEAFNEYLQTFHLAANWKGAPGNMYRHYAAYDEFLIAARKLPVLSTDRPGRPNQHQHTYFTKALVNFNQGNVPGKLELLAGGKWVKVDEDVPNNYTARNMNTYNTFHAPGKVKDRYDPSNGTDFTENSRWGFAKVTLGYDFGHNLFPSVLSYVISQNALAKAAADIKAMPPQPYTPEFTSLHLDYVLSDALDVNANPEHVFVQLHPFGFATIDSPQQPLADAAYDRHGQLYLGLSNCTEPQIVNLYIARLDGTEDIDALINENIEWQYLSGDNWQKFKYEEVVTDTTNGFTSSGFISFAIPKEALLPNTLMGENLVWIKAVTATSAGAYPSILDVFANATEAIFSDNNNDPYHLSAPLAAGTIAKPVVKIEGVKSVKQPYASYNGRMAEQETGFFTRTSERLRHKQRSWSIWDHERLLLDKFPAIYKIKCISHAEKDDMYTPGHVLCVALPSTQRLAEKDLLQPRISKGVLQAAETYLADFMSTFAKIEVINPVYEIITVKCGVKMKTGFDETFYAGQLNKDLQQFISPWLADKNISPSFEGTIYASGIVNFIEERPYIDYITDFEATKTEGNNIITWTESTSGSSEDVILTSAVQHSIDTSGIC